MTSQRFGAIAQRKKDACDEVNASSITELHQSQTGRAHMEKVLNVHL